MSGNLLDVVLVVAAALFAVSGYRQGFLVGVLSFAGFLGGGLLGARYAPALAELGPLRDLPPPVVGLVVVFLAATLGQVLATVVGGALRGRLVWRRARQVDAVAGAAVSVVSLLLVSWLVGRAVASSAYPELASQVRRSLVVTTVDGLVPQAGRRLVTDFQGLLDEQDFPEVFADLRATEDGGAAAPDPALADSPAVRRARPAVLKITGVARSCGKRVEGTGFVYAPGRVMTNAHVVAGVRAPVVEVAGRELAATVVLFDPARDLAVLSVRGLDVAPLQVAPAAAGADDDAIVVGYPGDGPFRSDAARIIRRQVARGEDIYGDRITEREVYSLKGLVQPGNSGGPLLDASGRVLGVIFAAAADDRSVGYALTWSEAESAAESGVGRTGRVSTRSCDG